MSRGLRSRMSGDTVVQVSRLCRRFVEERLAGLEDKARSSGRDDAQPPPAGIEHWNSRDLANEVGVSHSTVHRIWRAHDLSPHRIETFKFSTDPTPKRRFTMSSSCTSTRLSGQSTRSTVGIQEPLAENRPFKTRHCLLDSMRFKKICSGIGRGPLPRRRVGNQTPYC